MQNSNILASRPVSFMWLETLNTGFLTTRFIYILLKSVVCSALIRSNMVYIGPVKQFYKRTIANIFLSISSILCFGCSKEPSHRDGSFEYPQHMFWMRNKENRFPICTLIWRPGIHVPRLAGISGTISWHD